MVNPLRPRKSQDLWVTGLLWMVIGLLRRANEVVSKLKGPLKFSQADISGAMLNWRSRFSVSSVWGISLSQRKLGNVLETPARMEIKCALKVWIIHSAVLQQ